MSHPEAQHDEQETTRETGRVATEGVTTVQSVRADADAAPATLATGAAPKKKRPATWTDDPATAGTWDATTDGEADTWDDEEPPAHATTGQAVQ